MIIKFIYIFSHDIIIVLFPYGVLTIHCFFKLKFCKLELQPGDGCETSEMSLINWICPKIFTYFSSPYILYKFLQDVTGKIKFCDVIKCLRVKQERHFTK